MSQEQILLNKDGLVLKKTNKNHYNLEFDLMNKHIVLPKILDFSIVKLVYDLNKDVYEKVNLEKINDNEAIITILLKHFFEDLGLPQKFSHVHITKYVEDDKIVFKNESIRTSRPEYIPENAELVLIKNMTTTCSIISDHHIKQNINIMLDNNMPIPQFMEKMFVAILNKMFKRVKQFIENIRM
jgi:hypothetical protein